MVSGGAHPPQANGFAVPSKTRSGAGVRTCACAPDACSEDCRLGVLSHVPAAPWSGSEASGLIRESSSLGLVAPVGAGSKSRTGALSCGADDVIGRASAGCLSDATATPGAAAMGDSAERTPAPAIATTAIRLAIPLANRTIFATNLVTRVAQSLEETLVGRDTRTTSRCWSVGRFPGPAPAFLPLKSQLYGRLNHVPSNT